MLVLKFPLHTRGLDVGSYRQPMEEMIEDQFDGINWKYRKCVVLYQFYSLENRIKTSEIQKITTFYCFLKLLIIQNFKTFPQQNWCEAFKFRSAELLLFILTKFPDFRKIFYTEDVDHRKGFHVRYHHSVLTLRVLLTLDRNLKDACRHL